MGGRIVSEFLTELYIRDLSDDLCQLTADLIYRSEIFGSEILVATNFITDFASVPRVPIVYEAFGNRAHREAVIHDYLYQTGVVKRAVADSIFLEAMAVRGKPLWVRWGMYMGVRMGGWKAWNNYRRLEQEKK